MTDRDIIVVGQQGWYTKIGSNCKDIALEFSKQNRVLYVNPPLDRITQIRSWRSKEITAPSSEVKALTDGLELVAPNLWVFTPLCVIESINWIKLPLVFDILNLFNNKTFAKSIKKAIKILEFTKFILFNDNDIFRCFYLKELLSPRLSLYYSRDNITATDYWKFHGSRLEPLLMEKSDVCVANSTYLANRCSIYNSKSFYVGQGCEINISHENEKPPLPIDMKGIEGPIIGYAGAIVSVRLSFEIIKHIAVQRPQWSIVLIGPEDDFFTGSELHSYKNVFFLGMKEPKALYSYVANFDVAINPQAVNELTIGNYPRKIDEYLAAGKPVVATATEAMEPFNAHCYLASDKEEFLFLIEKAMDENSQDLVIDRIHFAETHTWQNSVQKIYAAILSELSVLSNS
jgi:glycosyltransferase involved in cell wall biosynthesis